MKTRIIRPVALTLALAIIGVSLSGCHKSLEGTYTDDSGIFSVEFKKDGTGLIKAVGNTQDITYKIDGNKATVTAAAGGQSMTTTFTINDDGTLAGPQGTLKKK